MSIRTVVSNVRLPSGVMARTATSPRGVSAAPDPLGAGLAQAHAWLASGAAKRVVLAGISRAFGAAPELPAAALFCLDRGCGEVPQGEAAAALVLEAPGAGRAYYAVLSGAGDGKGESSLAQALAHTGTALDCYAALELDLVPGVELQPLIADHKLQSRG